MDDYASNKLFEVLGNGNVNIGTTEGVQTLNIGGWVGTEGNTGWYNSTHSGGIYMIDSTYVRVYNGKQLFVENWIGTNVGFLAHNYGVGLVGQYSATRYQNVFSMGTTYIMAADGTALNSHYGIAWTHENIGGQSKAGLGHQMLITEAGVTQTAIGNGIWTRASIYAAGQVTAPTIEATGMLIVPTGMPSPADMPANKWVFYVEEL